MRFEAMLREGIVTDKVTGNEERKTFIFAEDIPAAALNKEWKGPHPHKVPGLAWSFTDSNWRNLKNANVIGCITVNVEADMESPRWFTVVD